MCRLNQVGKVHPNTSNKSSLITDWLAEVSDTPYLQNLATPKIALTVSQSL